MLARLESVSNLVAWDNISMVNSSQVFLLARGGSLHTTLTEERTYSTPSLCSYYGCMQETACVLPLWFTPLRRGRCSKAKPWKKPKLGNYAGLYKSILLAIFRSEFWGLTVNYRSSCKVCLCLEPCLIQTESRQVGFFDLLNESNVIKITKTPWEKRYSLNKGWMKKRSNKIPFL